MDCVEVDLKELCHYRELFEAQAHSGNLDARQARGGKVHVTVEIWGWLRLGYVPLILKRKSRLHHALSFIRLGEKSIESSRLLVSEEKVRRIF